MKLLVSVKNKVEAMEALLGGADIIDVKNPVEGSLGAPFPRIIRSIVQITAKEREVSTAIGDAPDLPGTVSLAAFGAAVCEVDYVKLGIYGPKSFDSALLLAEEACRASKENASGIKVVIAGYADHERAGCLDAALIPEIVRRSGADGAMVDTKVKDGRSIFSFLSGQQLLEFVDKVHANGLTAVIAGSLGIEDVKRVYELRADIIGFRAAACTGDRVNGRIEKVNVLRIKNRMITSRL